VCIDKLALQGQSVFVSPGKGAFGDGDIVAIDEWLG
jgi:hypothetical protein